MRKRPVSVPASRAVPQVATRITLASAKEEEFHQQQLWQQQQQQQQQILLETLPPLGFNIDFQKVQPCVTKVQKGTDAAAAGVKKGDLLVTVDGISVTDTNRARIADKLREKRCRPLKVVLVRPAVAGIPACGIPACGIPASMPNCFRHSDSEISIGTPIRVRESFETTSPRNVRNLLVEAVENNDVEEIRILISKAVACGVDSAEIINAEHHLDFLDERAAWVKKWGSGLPGPLESAQHPVPGEQLESVTGLQAQLETMRVKLAEQEARCRAAEEERACLQKDLEAVRSQLVDQKELRAELETCLEERNELESELTELKLQFPCGTAALCIQEHTQFSVSSAEAEATCRDSSLLREFQLDEICLEGETLGNGAVGTVCKAQLMVDKQEKTVAVKQFGADTDAFLMERKYLPKLHHPNIVEVLGQLTLEEGPCLVLELLRKPDWVNLQPARALRDILQGVQYIHNHETTHLDIKVDNIMQACNGDESAPLKLIDFSIAASTEQAGKGFMGSLPFAAPELLSDSPWWGAPADLFSVGVILVFMVGLNLLFHHLGWAKDIEVHDVNERRHALPKLTKAWESLAAELKPGDSQEICRNLLHFRPEARPTATDALCYPWLSESNARECLSTWSDE